MGVWQRELPPNRSREDRQPGTLSRNEYTDLETPKDESEDGENVSPCEASKTVTRAAPYENDEYGRGAKASSK